MCVFFISPTAGGWAGLGKGRTNDSYFVGVGQSGLMVTNSVSFFFFKCNTHMFNTWTNPERDRESTDAHIVVQRRSSDEYGGNFSFCGHLNGTGIFFFFYLTLTTAFLHRGGRSGAKPVFNLPEIMKFNEWRGWDLNPHRRPPLFPTCLQLPPSPSLLVYFSKFHVRVSTLSSLSQMHVHTHTCTR